MEFLCLRTNAVIIKTQTATVQYELDKSIHTTLSKEPAQRI